MAAGTFNITIEKRATFSFETTFTQADGSALDLTDRTLIGEIRRNFDFSNYHYYPHRNNFQGMTFCNFSRTGFCY